VDYSDSAGHEQAYPLDRQTVDVVVGKPGQR
jgi:hypothetical protein